MEKCIIAAVAENGAIGRDNALLWHISGDMKYFRKLTTGFPVIMGRKTFESIGRPLPKRRNIVVTRTLPSAEGIETAGSLSEAFAMAESGEAGAPLRECSSSENSSSGTALSGDISGMCAEAPARCFVIGGGEIYRQAIAEADMMYITRVHCTIEDADTFFPAVSPDKWEETACSEAMTDPESGLVYEFAEYRRKR